MTTVSTTTIIELINIHGCDEAVANMLQCPVSVVTSHRELALLVRQNAERKAAEKTDKRIAAAKKGEETRYSNEQNRIKEQSERLLIRQLETGQHALCVDRFKRMVVSLGLTDRLPKALLT
jgi:hypothetical protein